MSLTMCDGLPYYLTIRRVLALLLPTAFFSSIGSNVPTQSLITDELRLNFVKMSRGLAVLLLVVYVVFYKSYLPPLIFHVLRYIASRIYLHNPPGEMADTALPEALRKKEKHLQTHRPEVNVWSCMLVSFAVIAAMTVTAWMVSISSVYTSYFALKTRVKLVDSIEFVQKSNNIQEE
jgi:hypothetical protein